MDLSATVPFYITNSEFIGGALHSYVRGIEQISLWTFSGTPQLYATIGVVVDW